MIKISITNREFDKLNIKHQKFIDLDAFPILIKEEYQHIYSNKDHNMFYLTESYNGDMNVCGKSNSI